MENKKHWWQECQPYMLCAVQCNLGDDPETVLDEYVSQNSFTIENNLHLVAKGHMGYYSEAKHGEKLDRYLKKAHKHGLKELIYYNTHCVGKEFSDPHPDWLQRKRDGSSISAYEIYDLVCVNPNGPWHKNFLKEIAALAKHDVNGITLDGPVMMDCGCYCDTCRADFEKRFGHSIYDATRLEMQSFRVDLVTEHIKQASEVIKSINPEILVKSNNSALRADITGSNTRRLSKYIDTLSAEGGFHRAEMGPEGLWHPSYFAKYLECMAGETLEDRKPYHISFSGNHSGIAYYSHTPAETTLTYSQGFANGANIWYGIHYSPTETKDLEAITRMREMNEYILKNKDIYSGSMCCARVAIMWSQSTANNYASSTGDSDFVSERAAGFSQRGDHRGALISTFDMLARNHIQVNIIDEVSILNGGLNRYDFLILPEVACLGDDVAKCIADYVKNGGNILGNFDVGMYDEFGVFNGESKLGEVFGLVGTPEVVESKMIGMSYMFVQEKDHPLFKDLTYPRIPAPMLNAEWQVADDVKVLMRNCHPMPSTYASLPEENRYPSITEHKYGKGTAYYISGNFAETAMRVRNITDYKQILRNMCDLASRSTVVSDEAGLYEVVLRRQKDRFILHIVNLTSAMTRPVEKIVPLSNLNFKLNLEGFEIDIRDFNVKTIRGGNLQNVAQNGAELSFTLDKLDAYEVIVIE